MFVDQTCEANAISSVVCLSQYIFISLTDGKGAKLEPLASFKAEICDDWGAGHVIETTVRLLERQRALYTD